MERLLSIYYKRFNDDVIIHCKQKGKKVTYELHISNNFLSFVKDGAYPYFHQGQWTPFIYMENMLLYGSKVWSKTLNYVKKIILTKKNEKDIITFVVLR